MKNNNCMVSFLW